MKQFQLIIQNWKIVRKNIKIKPITNKHKWKDFEESNPTMF